jgi:hypothetical protein
MSHLNNKKQVKKNVSINAQIFYMVVQPVAPIYQSYFERNIKMITSTRKNNTLICMEHPCDNQAVRCPESDLPVEQQARPLRKYLHDLWVNIRLFVEADKWDHQVTLKVGDSHYTMKMDEIEARWRNR